MNVRDILKAVIKEKGYIQAAIARKSNLSPIKSSQILSKERRLEANELFVGQHPWVDDPQQELERLEKQRRRLSAELIALRESSLLLGIFEQKY